MAEGSEQKHEKHEGKHHEKKSKGEALPTGKQPILILFIALAFLCGALIGITAIYFYLSPQLGEEPSPESCAVQPVITTTTTTSTPENMGCITLMPADKVKDKVKYFVDESFLKARNASLKIEDIESLNECLYKIDAKIVTEQGELSAGSIYATKDGQKIFLGAVYDLNKPLEQPTPEPVEYKKSDKPKVLMFVMSFCPFGQQAERGLKPAIELLGDTIEFEPHYVIYSKDYGYSYPDYCLDKNAQYCSMHGIAELREDVRQLCIWKYEPDKFWPYVEKIYEGKCSLNDIDTCWKEQAQAVGIDVVKIEECFNNEAFVLLEEEVKLNKKYNVRGSPTILINETEYKGDRSPESFKDAICSAFDEQPEECSQELSGETGAASGGCG
jgi:protein-disulfide isomerase